MLRNGASERRRRPGHGDRHDFHGHDALISLRLTDGTPVLARVLGPVTDATVGAEVTVRVRGAGPSVRRESCEPNHSAMSTRLDRDRAAELVLLMQPAAVGALDRSERLIHLDRVLRARNTDSASVQSRSRGTWCPASRGYMPIGCEQADPRGDEEDHRRREQVFPVLNRANRNAPGARPMSAHDRGDAEQRGTSRRLPRPICFRGGPRRIARR